MQSCKLGLKNPSGVSNKDYYFCRAYFRRSLFSEGLIIGLEFAFQNGLDLTIKTA